MEFNNISTFLRQYPIAEDKTLDPLKDFTTYPKYKRDIDCKSMHRPFSKHNREREEYIFHGMEKEYPFALFSNYLLQEVDQKILCDEKQREKEFFRPLKLACSMDFVDPRIAIGNSKTNIFHLLILFYEDGIDKVADYPNNIVMEKEKYYELFQYEELNVLDFYDLYCLYIVMDQLHDFDHIFEYLIFQKEIWKELSKQKEFSFLKRKYNSNGVNYRNFTLFGDYCDWLFFEVKDMHHSKYEEVKEELDEFTKNPKEKTKHIRYHKKEKKYVLKDKQFGSFPFRLLSDIVEDEEVKQVLLSDARYGECHVNSNILAGSINENVVGGKMKSNDRDYFYHSWVELEKNNLVFDFNHNLIIDKDIYYKLYDAVPISKTKASDMEEIGKMLLCDSQFQVHPMILNYFGMEMMKDVKRNEKILRK